MPSFSVPVTLNVFPEACGSPASKALRLMSRRISFSLKTSTAALTRSSVELVSSIASSPFHAILVSVPRKSNRVESSLAAWVRALSTSCRSSVLTTSNDESAIGYVPFLRSWPFVIRVHLRCRLATRTTPADCPSGQWERTVNPSAYAYPGSNPGSATKQEVLHGVELSNQTVRRL